MSGLLPTISASGGERRSPPVANRDAPRLPLDLVGGTPLAWLRRVSERLGIELYAKLEACNPTGSVKDRTARSILDHAAAQGLLTPGTTVVESSSGNLGIALAAACRQRGLRFICVADPNITGINARLIRHLGADLQIVSERDPRGGYLSSRIERVNSLVATIPESFWTEQYHNPWNTLAHYRGTGPELFAQLEGHLDYVFAAVSTGGTIMGCARFLKERDPRIRVVAVDPVGSVIFGGEPRSRYVPGAGASRIPELLEPGCIDDVVHVDEFEGVFACHRLLREESLCVGGSAGLVLRGIEEYFDGNRTRRPRVAAIFADRGDRYFDSVFDRAWLARHRPDLAQRLEEF